MEKIIFFGNGMLADYSLVVLERYFEVVFHARTREDLEKVIEVKKAHPEAHGVLASFGVMIKGDLLELFEPEGILNIHPSLLPKYRGASPIESAILAGDTDFSVSIMKLVRAMDAGPIYYQTTLKGLPLNKESIYKSLAEAGAEWIGQNLKHLLEPFLQSESGATFTEKITKKMGLIEPGKESAEKILRKIVAYAGFPKVKCALCGQNCAILEAHIPKVGEKVVLALPCLDGEILAVDKLQPDGRKAMDARSFLNGYCKFL